jgi:hypothetical protein
MKCLFSRGDASDSVTHIWKIASMHYLHRWVAEPDQHIMMLINHDTGVLWYHDRGFALFDNRGAVKLHAGL